MSENKIGFIIQARMESGRMPHKVLLPLPWPDGKPMLAWIVDELQRVPVKKDLVVATSTSAADDKIASFCRKNEIACYRGKEADVLSRYREVTWEEGYDTVIRYTGDNPFVDRDIIKAALDYHHAHDFELTYTAGLPLGIHVEIIKAAPLLETEDRELSAIDKEHVTQYFYDRDRYRKGVFTPKVPKPLSHLRVTVDYPADVLVASALCRFAQQGEKKRGLSLIKAAYEQAPWIFDVNKRKLQKNPSNRLQGELEEAVKVLDRLDYKRAAELLRNHS